MSERTRATSSPAPARAATPPKKEKAPPVADNSAVLEQMQTGPTDFTLGNHQSNNTYGWATDGSTIEAPGTGRKTSDPFGDGIQRVQREREVVGTKKVKNKGPGFRTQKKRETVTTVDNAGFSEGSLTGGRSKTREKRNGQTITDFTGMNVDLSDPLSATATTGRTTKNRDGTASTHSGSLNKEGASYAYTREGEKGSVGGYAAIGDHEVRGGLNGSRNLGKNLKVGGGIHGGLILDRDHTSMVGDVSKAKGLDSFAADVVNWGNRDAEGNAQHTPLMVHGYDNGHQIAGNLSVQAGVVGVKANAHHSKQTSANFHTTNRSVDAGVMKKLGASGVEVADLPTMAVDHPRLYKRYMEEAYGDRTLAPDQSRASNLQELDVDGLKPGEGFSLQTNSAAGGGAGVSVYGIGGSMHGNKAQTQRTVVHRNPDGSTTFDISTAKSATLGGDIEGGGGIVNAGMSGSWGDAAKLRFTFDDSKQGREAMEEFQKTGVLPGAMDDRNPMKARYQALAGKDPKNLSSVEKAELQTMAESANASMLMSDPTTEEFKSVPGVKFDQHKKGAHESTELHAGFLGLNFLTRSTTRTNEVMRYSENGEELLNYVDTYNKDYFFDQADKGYVNVNRPGSTELALDAELDLPDDERRKEVYQLDGKGMPDWSVFGGYDGDKDRVSFNMSKSDIPVLAEHGNTLPFWSASRNFKGMLDTRESLKGDLASPVDQGQVAQRMLREQVQQEMMASMGPMPLGGPGADPRLQLMQPVRQSDPTTAFLPPQLNQGFGRRRNDPISLLQQQRDPFGLGGDFSRRMEQQDQMRQALDNEVGKRMMEKTLEIEKSGGMDKWLGEQNPETVMETVRGIRGEQMKKYAQFMNGDGGSPHLGQLAEVMNGQDFRSLPPELQETYFRRVPSYGQNQVNLLRADKIRRDAFIYRQLKGGDPDKIVRFVEDLKPGEKDSPVLQEWYRRNLHVGRN